MKLRTEIMNTKKANQIECYKEFNRLTEMIKETNSEELKRQRRKILRKLTGK